MSESKLEKFIETYFTKRYPNDFKAHDLPIARDIGKACAKWIYEEMKKSSYEAHPLMNILKSICEIEDPKPELLKCPFCTGSACHTIASREDPYCHGVNCKDCGAHTQLYRTIAEAVKYWNRRT